ncbi:MAG: ABC transporter substrate-binding protein [Chromatiales bacterium]|nr:ABC transporter substrate-binding protein [Chromatiales bacterium]
MALASAPGNLDPRFATDAVSARIIRLLYRTLVDFDEQFRPVPDLADWKVVSPVHYRFTLRELGREFSNGRRLDSEDVAATYRFVLDPVNASPHRANLQRISRIETPDVDTVDFHLDRPDPLFPGYLVIAIVPREEADLGHAPVGSGGFALESWPEEGRLRLRRRADDVVVELLTVKDPTVRALKLLRGEVDLLQNDLPPELVGYLREQDGVAVERRNGSNFSYLGFNLQDPWTGRREVREAVAKGIDRAAIVRYLLKGGAAFAGALLPPDHWAGNPNLHGYDYDPDGARRLLAGLGFGPEHPLTLSYKTSSDPLRLRIATVIQAQLRQVGIELDLRSYDWGTFYGDIKAGRFQMYSLAWVGIKTPDILRYVFHSRSLPPEGANRGRYRSAAADALIESAETASTLEAQASYYRQLQALIHHDLPYVPLWYEDHVAIHGRSVTGFTVARDGNYDGLNHLRPQSRESL